MTIKVPEGRKGDTEEILELYELLAIPLDAVPAAVVALVRARAEAEDAAVALVTGRGFITVPPAPLWPVVMRESE